MDGQHRMQKRDHPSELEDKLSATLRSKKSKGDLKRYAFDPFILCSSVSRAGSQPGDPEAGPRRLGGRGRSGLTL